ncbi:MAG: exosortase/archaeosortase family protein [Cyanobacteriota bacterium]
MASTDLIRRWQALDDRALWLLLAALMAGYLLVLTLLTQSPDEAVNMLLLIGGAVLLAPGFPEGWQPRPGRVGRWLGLALLLAVFWRGQRIDAFDFGSSLLLPMAGFGLVLLAAPVRQWRPFAWPLAVLAVLPLWRAVGWLTPLGPLSELTAWLSRQWLELSGFSASQQGLFLYLPGGGVKVAGACAGLNILLQLVVVALLFAKAFPMRRRWQNSLMILLAPVLAVLINAMRIALLAWINASGLPQKQWWFDFLHDSWGGLVFAGVAMQLFVWLYVYWLARQVAALGSR